MRRKRTQPIFQVLESGGGGADVSVVTATAPDVDEGKVFVDSTGTEVTGTSTAKTDLIKMISRTVNVISRMVIPEGTNRIGDYAFARWAGLKSVVIPETVTYIGQFAFWDCAGLEIDHLPSGLSAIHMSAFENCQKITISDLPIGLTNIDTYAFRNCQKITISGLPIGLTSIGMSAFYNCPLITISEIPIGVRQIQEQAFYGCTGLTEMTFKATPQYGIKANSFQGCTNLTTIRVPWQEGEVANAPWGATNATLIYNYTP